MSISDMDGEALWDSFLHRWPLEKLNKITLQEYTKAGNPDCFTYGWLENKTTELGSIWGGSAFKFGVYSRKDQSDKKDGEGKSYSTEYGWYSKYGKTPEEAFERVSEIIVGIANAARSGDLEAIVKADIGSATKWKIAFLYQDRSAPTILPIYSSEILAVYLKQSSKIGLGQLQREAMAKCDDADVLTFGRKIWEHAEGLILKPEEALAFFQNNPERFQSIKPPTKYIAGFMTSEGRNLAVSLNQKKEAKLWLEPGEWLGKVNEKLKDIEDYPPERPRSSNLSANAPNLGLGKAALFLTVPTHAALVALCDAYENFYISENSQMPTNTPLITPMITPLNQILFGPPGTGKTFATIDESLRILDQNFLKEHAGPDNRTALKERFDELAATGQVRFVTFHQSFSYEDFVEGLRAVTNDDKQLEYTVEPGVFKLLCDDARTQALQPGARIRSNPKIWKITIDGVEVSQTREYCFNHGEARVDWGDTGDLRQSVVPDEYYKSIGPAAENSLRYFSAEMVPGDILLCIHSPKTIGAVGVVTGDYSYEETVPKDVRSNYKHVRKVNWLYQGLELPIMPLNGGKQFNLFNNVHLMHHFTCAELLEYVKKSGAKSTVPSVVVTDTRKPHVLIIDEINRGNISRIFGELITLIEPSKRAGADEELSVTLPYSKKTFSVPNNVFLIGTMNTADRSLAGLDIALRRRFTFKEMPPKPEFLDDIEIQGVNVGKMLSKMNERIEVLLDRDHCLGHAYFMSLKDSDAKLNSLKVIFRNQILPLLQEYFFEDYERIAWVLNDQNKPEEYSFVQKKSPNLAELFGSKVANDLQNEDRRWRINEKAFDKIESYRGIIDCVILGVTA
jgi:5-methylcytosine-specific restriction protein B